MSKKKAPKWRRQGDVFTIVIGRYKYGEMRFNRARVRGNRWDWSIFHRKNGQSEAEIDRKGDARSLADAEMEIRAAAKALGWSVPDGW